MFKKLFAALGYTIAVSLSGVWALLKLALDNVARADLVRGLGTSDSVLAKLMTWLFSTPWEVPTAILLLALFAWIHFTHILIRRSDNYEDSSNKSAHKKSEDQNIKPGWPDPYTPISVVGKTFRNEKVMIDGYLYSNCTFINVTFVYNGTTAPQMINNHFDGVWLTSDNLVVTGVMIVAKGLGFLRENFPVELPPGTKVDAPSK